MSECISREGFLFRGKVHRPEDDPSDETRVAHLYVEGQLQAAVNFKFRWTQYSNFEAYEAAFQVLSEDNRWQVITDNSLKVAMETYAEEKARGISYNRKSWRFIEANRVEVEEGDHLFVVSGPRTRTFILTQDKTDLRN